MDLVEEDLNNLEQHLVTGIDEYHLERLKLIKELNEKANMINDLNTQVDQINKSAQNDLLLQKELMNLKIRELELKVQLKNSESEDLNFDKLERKFVITKFNGQQDIYEFISDFEQECNKHKITSEEKIIQALKYFLKDKALEWYQANRKRIGKNWSDWKVKLIKVFGDSGWMSTKRAYEFKYMSGKLSEYAIKKQRLLLEDDNSIPEQILIKMIVIGLPGRLFEKLKKTEILQVEELLSELIRLDGEYNFKKPLTKSTPTTTKDHEKKKDKVKDKEWCKIKNHLDANCWFKDKRNATNLFQVEQTDSDEEEKIEVNLSDSKN